MDQNNIEINFKKGALQQIFAAQKKNPSTKINKDALKLWNEFLKLMTIEAVHRACEQANSLNSGQSAQVDRDQGSLTVIDVDAMEKIAAQLMIDF